jgi:hypothetical protein
MAGLTFCSCTIVHTQSNSNTPSNYANSNTVGNSNSSTSGDVGYARFTTSDKTYLGCWRSTKAPEVVNYKLAYFRFTDKTIQKSGMSRSVSYTEVDSNRHKDWFVLETRPENQKISLFLNINIDNENEITVGEQTGKNDDYEDYWNLRRVNCVKALKRLRAK